MKILAILTLSFLTACATPRGYERLPWARVSVDQAEAQCDYEVQADPLIGYETCMQSKGWHPVY